MLKEVARYFFRGDDNVKGKALSYEEFSRLGLRSSRGVLELLAQTCQLVWQEPLGLTESGVDGLAWRREDLIARPQAMADTKAGTYFSAIDQAFPELSLAKLCEMNAKVRFVCMVMGGDLASSNI
eukprot:1801095-Lingulodinium_polyedra.AAC.1